MKKILIVTYNYYPEIGSAANRMTNMYRLLPKHGFDVDVLTTEPNYPNRNMYADYDKSKHAEFETNVHRLHMRTRNYSGNMFKRLVFYVEMLFQFLWFVAKSKKKYDIVILSSPPIFLGVIGPLLKWWKGWKCVIDLRDLWPESLKGVGVFNGKIALGLAYMLERWIYSAADFMIINSEAFQSYLDAHGFHKPTTFIPNSINADEFRYANEVVKEEHDVFEVIYTGNIGLAQDTGSFLDLAARFKGDAGVRFSLIGYGVYKDELLQRIATEGLTNVQYLGAKSRSETMHHVARSDAAYVCLTSQAVFDTVLPGKIVDYMAAKTPIIGYVSGYAKETIDRAQCGYVSGERSIDEIEHYLRTLMNDRNHARMLGENGYHYAEQTFNWARNSEKLAKELEDLLCRKQ
ncbi:MAG: glycosyltransferase family 4 protein [Bacilli bacterium]